MRGGPLPSHAVREFKMACLVSAIPSASASFTPAMRKYFQNRGADPKVTE